MPIDILSALQSVGDEPGSAQSPGAGAPPSGGVNILAALQAAGQQEAPPAPLPAPTRLERFATGFGDTFYGLGNLAQHAAGPVLNLARRGISAGLKAAGDPNAAAIFAPVSNSDWDNIVANREQAYDRARAQAGQTGIDWWRLAGEAANPTNYLASEDAAATVLGRVGQAALQGAGVGAAQAAGTAAVPGQTWWDAAKGAVTGGATGGLVGGLIEGAAPALRLAMGKVRNLMNGGTLSSSTAADQVVKDALAATGTDPASIDLNLLKAMRGDVQSALDSGADISPTAVSNRARAESLPVPVQLTRGQATGDPMLFAREQNLRGIQGVGEPITARLQQQNAAFIGNLDALGAKNAPTTVETGTQIADQVHNFWNNLQTRKNALYGAVRNSQGQPAAMDGIAAADQIHKELDTPQAGHDYDLLPDNIKRTIDDLQSGDLPFSVGQMEALDKRWGAAARGADPSVAHAINQARSIIGNASVSDDVGEQARQAYFAARQAHAQQMALIDPDLPNGQPNPKFQPIVKAVIMDGKPPESLFGAHFLNAPASVGAKNLAFLRQLDPNAPETIGRTLMGEIKRQALNDSSADRGTVSEAVLRHWAHGPVASARLDALLPAPQVSTFRNLADTVEAAKKQPVSSAVNSSNSGSAVVNAGMSMLKNNILSQIAAHFPYLESVPRGFAAAQVKTDVHAALNPGVSLKSLLTATPSQAVRNRLVSRALVPAAVSYQGLKSR